MSGNEYGTYWKTVVQTMLDRELFGHVKGAFTGACRNRKERFEAARGGDIFPDEIIEYAFVLCPGDEIQVTRDIRGQGCFCAVYHQEITLSWSCSKTRSISCP